MSVRSKTEASFLALMVAAGAYVLLPVVVLFGLAWFVETLQNHHQAKQIRIAEMQARAQRITPRGRKIPKCDKPLWDRITDGCDDQVLDND